MAAARAKPSLARKRTAAAIAASPSRRVVERVILRLPVPPSANDVWAIRGGGKGMRLDPSYARWLTDAGWRVQQQRVGRIVGGYHITLYLPASSGMDQDNSIAAVSDLMQLQGVIGNDRDAEKTDLRWHGDHNDVVIDLCPFYGSARHLRPLPSDLREAA